MAERNQESKKITISSSKKEMLAAYNELLKKLQEKQERLLEPEKRVEQKAVAQALKTADSLSTEGVVKGIGQLKAEVSTLLTQVSDRLEGEVHKYKALQKAIEAKEKDLAEVYEIERAAATLAALIEAQQQKRESFEAEMAAKKQELQGEVETTRFEWAEEKARRAAEIKEQEAEEQKRRQREKEDYRYAFERERKLARDQFEDEKKKLEAEMAAKREQAERELASRQEAVALQEKEIEELRARVESFPKEIETAVQKAAKEATERVRLEAKNREELLVKESSGEKNVLTARIESLQKTVQEQNQQIARLSQALEKAYDQVQDIAVKTVEGSSSAKALSGLQQLLSEQQKKTTSN